MKEVLLFTYMVILGGYSVWCLGLIKKAKREKEKVKSKKNATIN